MSFRFLQKEQKMFPSILGTKGTSVIIPLKGGRNSLAFQVNNFVIRFPKDECVWKQQQQEVNLLSELKDYLSPKWKNKIPNMTCCLKNGYPFTQYPFIKGNTCNQGGDQSLDYECLSPKNQLKLAKQLAEFLVELHQISGHLPSAKQEWVTPLETDFSFNEVQTFLLKATNGIINLVQFQTKLSLQNTALMHNDLSGSNILLKPHSKSILTGIIDFANAGIGPLICDFIPLYKISRKLARETIEAYNTLSPKPISLKEADYLLLCYVGYHLKKSPSRYLTGILNRFINDFLL